MAGDKEERPRDLGTLLWVAGIVAAVVLLALARFLFHA